ncbi:hypothetical protein RJJ65_28350 [Rhizobium hidalgonense]|uniref:Uncharacterized protein n=3 Tax=Rhizobium TaxID=379 RepID=A0A2A6K6H6_9HYPH|nr:hypothetical protein [Rhizobium hidalgonense]MDR9776492.1 hypothetical protein [Rhizobium hidalgonense]MDR9814320.1 hypothetical protein [Rhizobium hidalgonense]MDR9823029.1 hypothetical protein [Rhizobium hidalgonense]PDT20447.1 hypothetical protein CO674_27670 [Rhizobium hidalgonense]PON06690.1 hypothetical protein ATY29_15255 [Rhizobium hidalgonense]
MTKGRSVGPLSPAVVFQRKNLDSCGKPSKSNSGKGISMVRDEHAIAECNDRARVAGVDIAVPVSAKTKAKTTTKTV